MRLGVSVSTHSYHSRCIHLNTKFLLQNNAGGNVFANIKKFKITEHCICVEQKVAVFAHVYQDDKLPETIKFGLESDLIKAMNISDSVLDDF